MTKEDPPPLDADALQLLTQIKTATLPEYETLSPSEARDRYNCARIATADLELEDIWRACDFSVQGLAGKITIRAYIPNAQAESGLIYFHGGGWVLGTLDGFESLCRKLANRSGAIVFSVEYRLAPEHPFPAALDDAVAATKAIFQNASSWRVDPRRIAIGGDSAGANLAAVTVLLTRDDPVVNPRFQLLIYPVTDLTMTSASQQEFAEGYLLTRALQHWFHEHYLAGTTALTDWRVSPLFAPDFTGMPASMIVTASHDPLRDEGEDYGARLVEGGNLVTFLRVNGQIHGFLAMDGIMHAAAPVMATIAADLRNGLSPIPHQIAEI